MLRKDQLKHGVALAVGLCILAFLLYLEGEALPAALASVHLGWLALGLLVSVVFYPLASYRWWLITNSMAGMRVGSYIDFLRARVTFAAGGFFAPREVVELGGRTVWLVKFRQQSTEQAVSGVLVDRLMDLMMSGIGLIGAVLFFLFQVSSAVSVVAMLGSGLALIVLVPKCLDIAQRMLDLERPTAAGWLGKLKTGLFGVLQLDHVTVRRALAVSYLKFVLILGRAIMIAFAALLALTPTEIVVLTPLGQLAYLVSITPGSLGIYEASWFGLLEWVGAGGAAAVAYVLLQRVCLIVAVVSMLPFFGGVQRTFSIESERQA